MALQLLLLIDVEKELAKQLPLLWVGPAVVAKQA